jgi:hypothetical protein
MLSVVTPYKISVQDVEDGRCFHRVLRRPFGRSALASALSQAKPDEARQVAKELRLNQLPEKFE